MSYSSGLSIIQPGCKLSLTIFMSATLFACDGNAPVATERYIASDALFETLSNNIAVEPSLEKELEIDHSRLGAEAQSPMPPARVLLFSNRKLETELLKENRLTAIDLPLRVLSFEPVPNGPSKIIYNSFEYLSSRYGLNQKSATESLFNSAMTVVLKGIDPANIANFRQNQMQPDGIITLDSPFVFKDTYKRVMQAINSADDAVVFSTIDFQSRAYDFDVTVAPTTLIMFGGPASGAKAIRNASTLGLDAFCQKFLVWEDDNGTVHLSFNDLLQLADRQEVKKSIVLRVIGFRLNHTFSSALSD